MSITNHIKYMKKQGRTRYMIETLIQKLDVEEKRVFIKLYNEKLKRLGVNEKYEPIPFEEI